MITPEQAKHEHEQDQLSAVRAFFTFYLRRGERFIHAPQESMYALRAMTVRVEFSSIDIVLEECRQAGWIVEGLGHSLSWRFSESPKQPEVTQ